MVTTQAFNGAKVALFVGDKLLITLRDDFDHIPWPNLWDLPGGGREGDETPFETVARETREEVGLNLTPAHVMWQRLYPSAHGPGFNWFFVAAVPARMAADVIFGDEGQGWGFVSLDSFLKLEQVVPTYAPRLRDWLAEGGAAPVADATPPGYL